MESFSKTTSTSSRIWRTIFTLISILNIALLTCSSFIVINLPKNSSVTLPVILFVAYGVSLMHLATNTYQNTKHLHTNLNIFNVSNPLTLALISTTIPENAIPGLPVENSIRFIQSAFLSIGHYGGIVIFSLMGIILILVASFILFLISYNIIKWITWNGYSKFYPRITKKGNIKRLQQLGYDVTDNISSEELFKILHKNYNTIQQFNLFSIH